MKKLEIIIKPEKLEDLKGVLDTEKVNGLNIVTAWAMVTRRELLRTTAVQSIP